jgi:hypothetical protein
MKRWIRWSIVFAVLAIPTAAFAATKLGVLGCCPIPGCPCGG